MRCPNCGAPVGIYDICAYCGTLLRVNEETNMAFEKVTLYADDRPVEVIFGKSASDITGELAKGTMDLNKYC